MLEMINSVFPSFAKMVSSSRWRSDRVSGDWSCWLKLIDF